MISNGGYSLLLYIKEFNSLFRTLSVLKRTLKACIFLRVMKTSLGIFKIFFQTHEFKENFEHVKSIIFQWFDTCKEHKNEISGYTS